jgi:hypothetical protein
MTSNSCRNNSAFCSDSNNVHTLLPTLAFSSSDTYLTMSTLRDEWLKFHEVNKNAKDQALNSPIGRSCALIPASVPALPSCEQTHPNLFAGKSSCRSHLSAYSSDLQTLSKAADC